MSYGSLTNPNPPVPEYPMLWETADWEMDTYSIELNTFLDVILNTVYKLGRSRIVVFSSFSPEMCIALSTKQQDYPVLFLNDAGLFPTGDLRASNVQEAVQFSRMWQLDGVVLASDPLVLYPRLINFVKNHGLICASYGALNNDPKSAKVSRVLIFFRNRCYPLHILTPTDSEV